MGKTAAELERKADSALAHALEGALPDLFAGPERASYRCFPCKCPDTRCYRVLKIRSLQRQYQRPAPVLECTAHGERGNGRRTSEHMLEFARILWDYRPDAKVIWEWNCVLGSSRMSIDASVWCDHRCTLFEIDGAQHFSTCMTYRIDADGKKDNLLNEQGLCVMRLHVQDQPEWAKYVRHHLRCPKPGVQYSKFYAHCIDGEHYRDRIVRL